MIPPTQAEIDKDAELEREEQLKEEKEKADSPSKAGGEKSPSKSKKNKKTFFPPDHLFKYELEELEDEEDEDEEEDGEDKKKEKAGLIYGHFFGGFYATSTPLLGNVTDNHRYSHLLANFAECQRWYHFCCLE